jgi:signal transduction histidine kinase
MGHQGLSIIELVAPQTAIGGAAMCQDELSRRLRAMATQISLSEESDRRRMSRSLHDDVGQPLAVAMMLLGMLRKTPGADTPAVLKQISELISQAIDRARSLEAELSPALLYELGLLPAIEWLAERTQRLQGLHVAVKGELPAEMQVSNSTKVILFQTIRELLNNIVRHARAVNAWVTITTEAGNGDGRLLCAEVRDDGIGFDADAAREGGVGMGLFNIQTAMEQMGGRFAISSRPGTGASARLSMPLDSRAETLAQPSDSPSGQGNTL